MHDGPGIRTVVFFKGCSLSCQWCANPECLRGKPQIGFIGTLCKNCGKCLDTCPNNAIQCKQGEHRIDYSRCIGCGTCSDQCYHGALIRYGESMNMVEVWDAVRRDRIFYDTSGGGITVSGGEPLLHANFIRKLFFLSHQEGIDTCVETCGMVNREAFLEVIPVTDHFLFDLKHMDSEAHRNYTGQSNQQILQNAALVVDSGADVIFRQPLIPGINDSIGNIEATAKFLKGLGQNAIRLEIMPYHRMGQSKYRALDIQYGMDGADAANEEQVKTVQKAYIERGLNCAVSQ
jgi:pyruvate formate lyase activating enzyme